MKKKDLWEFFAFRNKYLTAIILLSFISFNMYGQNGYDSTRNLQIVNGNGFKWKMGKFSGELTPPIDTVKMAVRDSGSIGFKNGNWYGWSGYKWNVLGGPDETAWHKNGDVLTGDKWIGTISNHDFVFKRQSVFAGMIGITNTGFGNHVLGNGVTVSGSYNTAAGTSSLANLSSGLRNTSYGTNSLNNTNTGNYNVAVGYNAGAYLTGTHSYNTMLGTYAGQSRTGNAPLDYSDTSIFIGYDAQANGNSEYNQIVIGNSVIGLGSNTTSIGNARTTLSKLFGRLRIPNTTTGPGVYSLRIDGSGDVYKTDTANSVISKPNKEVLFGTGSGVASASEYTYDTITHVLRLRTPTNSGKIGIEGDNGAAVIGTASDNGYISVAKSDGNSAFNVSASTGNTAINGGNPANATLVVGAVSVPSNVEIFVPTDASTQAFDAFNIKSADDDVNLIHLDASHKKFIIDEGNVYGFKMGIGIDPSYALDVNGDINTNSRIYTPGINVNGDEASFEGANMRINSGGNTEYVLLNGAAGTAGQVFYNTGGGYPVWANVSIGLLNPFSSFDLRSIMTSYTGTGNVVFSDLPTFTTAIATDGFRAKVASKTANYTATTSDYVISCSTNSFTVTLPTAVGRSGQTYYITNSTAANTITIATTSSQTFVNVTATPTSITQVGLGSTEVISDGANWIKLK